MGDPVAEAMSERLASRFQSDDWTRAHLPPLSRKEREAVRGLFAPVATIVLDFIQPFTVVKAVWAVPAVLGAVVELSHLPTRSIATRAVANLWLPAIDDLLDADAADPSVVDSILRECRLVICDGSDAANFASPIARLLMALRRELSAFFLWPQLLPAWTAALMGTIDCSAYERRLRLRAAEELDSPLLSMDEYLRFARESIGISWLFTTSLILDEDASSLNHLPDLLALAEHCAIAIRFANDVASFPRERAVRDLNAVVVLAAEIQAHSTVDEEAAVGEATKLIRQRVHQEILTARKLVRAIRTTSRVECRFLRATEFGVQLYWEHDFREWGDALGEPMRDSPMYESIR